MAINILGGKARGFILQVPPESITRPTAVMLKRRLFDWRQDWSGLSFVDLCAGSGAMGLEALSRGAQRVWLNEPNRTAAKVLEQNVARYREKIGLELDQELIVTQKPFASFLKHWPTPQSGVVLYFDPPYEKHALYAEFWEMAHGLDSEVWVESDEQKGVKLIEQRQHLSEVIKEVSQGSHWMLVGRVSSRR